MATSNLANLPEPLNLEDRTHRGDNWKRFKRDWSYYEVEAKIHKEEDSEVRVVHLVNVIGKDAQDFTKLLLSVPTIKRTSLRSLLLLKHAACQRLMLCSDYVRATGDKKGEHLKKTTPRLTMHNKSCEYPIGRTMLRVKRQGTTHSLHFYMLQKSPVTPILGRASCLGMNLIKIIDSDAIHGVETTAQNLFFDIVLKSFRDVFEGIGTLPGEYTIKTNNDIAPVVHPPRRLPIALQDAVKNELDSLVEARVLAPISKPTRWVSSMVVVE